MPQGHQPTRGGEGPRTLANAGWSIAPVGAAALLGSVATGRNIPGWYAGLAKPPFTPPNAAFGPVWTLLYVAMAYAVFRILSLPGSGARRRALAWFFVQLALNAAWSWSFFAAQSPALGAANILILLPAILITARQFWALDRLAGMLLVPYALWVGYATYLNLAIWRLNG